MHISKVNAMFLDISYTFPFIPSESHGFIIHMIMQIARGYINSLHAINKIIFRLGEHPIPDDQRHHRKQHAHCNNAEDRERPVVNWTPETFDKIVNGVHYCGQKIDKRVFGPEPQYCRKNH